MSWSASAIRLEGAVASLAFEARRPFLALRWPRRRVGRRRGERLGRWNRPAVSAERCQRTRPCPYRGDFRRSACVLVVRWAEALRHSPWRHPLRLFSDRSVKILLRAPAPVKSAIAGEWSLGESNS